MYTNRGIAIVKDGTVLSVSEVGVPGELSGNDVNAYAILMGKVAMANMNLSGDVQPLNDDEVIPGDLWESGVYIKRPELRMTHEQRIIEGYDDPPEGYVVDGGEIREMTNEERVGAGLMTQEAYDAEVVAAALAASEQELALRLSAYMSNESIARAEIDESYATTRKSALASLLSVRDQQGWPMAVEWTA